MSSESWCTDCTIENVAVIIFLDVSDGLCHVFRMIEGGKCPSVVLC